MQKILLLLLLMAGTATAQAQSLKDLLYGGKLKSDSNTVVRKTDDLKAKTDTVQKKPVVAAAEKTTVAAAADSAKVAAVQKDSIATAANGAIMGVDTVDVAVVAEAEAPEAAVVPAKSNTKLWKEYTDSLVATLTPELQNAKKVKNGTYHVLVSYEIETDGKVTANNVGITPANEMLHALIRQYVDSTPLQLAPTMDSAGQPRKMRRSGSFTITKD